MIDLSFLCSGTQNIQRHGRRYMKENAFVTSSAPQLSKNQTLKKQLKQRQVETKTSRNKEITQIQVKTMKAKE